MKLRKFFIILFVILSSFMVFATDSQDLADSQNLAENDLLLANEPIIFGEEGFIQRINEKTGGEREPIGVVLSGGSARAFAHIGVLQYLEENGIVPDFIVSNSMGSIIALMYSAGLSPEQIIQIIVENIGDLFDFTIPINNGLLNVDKFKAFISSYLGKDLKLEDLSIPVIVVCEDMVTKRQVLLAEGDFYEVLAASFALPVYFGSVEYEDCVLIDGGIANLVPLEIAYKYSNNILVSTTFYAGKDLNLKNPITGLNVSIDIGKRRQGVKELLNHPEAVWVRCNVEDFSFMDFASSSLLAQHGYSSCEEVGDEISELSALYNADEATTAINNEFKEKLEAKRAEFEIQIPIIKKNYEIFNRPPSIETSSMFGLNLSTHSSNGYLLRDDLLFGLLYSFSYEAFDLSIVAGGSVKPQAFGFGNYSEKLKTNSYVLPTVNLSLDFYLGNHFKFNLDGTLYYKLALSDATKFKYAALVSQAFQYRSGALKIASLSGDFKFIARETLEVTFKGSDLTGSFWDCNLPLSTLMGEMEYDSSIITASVKAGLQALGWPSATARLFGTTGFSLGINPWKFPIEIDLSINSRFAFDSKGEVPIFSSDGYLLVDPTLKAQGTGTSTATNAQQYVIASSISVDWTFYSQKLSLAELILLTDNKLGAFANLLWYSGIKPSAQVGAKLSTEVGFLGLKSAPLEVSVSYDFGVDRLLWKVELRTSV